MGLIAVTCVTSDASVARADPPPSSTCLATAQLVPGTSGTQVACLQFLLGLGGYYTGELTSQYDQATAQAVAAYQTAHPPLVANGVATVPTLTEMGIFESADVVAATTDTCTADANLPVGSTGAAVECIQRHLNGFGLFSDPVDGVLGPSTVAAIKVFQSKNPPLTSDGLPGPRTLAALGVWSGHIVGEPATTAAPGDSTPDPATAVGAAPGGPWPAPVLDYPMWNLTAQGIPYYGNHVACTLEDANTIAAQFARNAADVSTQQWAVYVASREGGCRYQAVNINPATRDDSHCTFQLNALSGMFEPHGELGRLGWTADNVTDSMQSCADAASDLWVYCGKGPWTPPYRCLQPWENDLGAQGDE